MMRTFFRGITDAASERTEHSILPLCHYTVLFNAPLLPWHTRWQILCNHWTPLFSIHNGNWIKQRIDILLYIPTLHLNNKKHEVGCMLHTSLNRAFVFASTGTYCVLFFYLSSLVSVSIPKISVDGKAVLGQPFKIRCQSDTGSLPINYTLLKDYSQLSTASVKLPTQQALFTVTINKPEEISKYMCEAKNNHKEAPLSKRLNATVIGNYSKQVCLSILNG